MPGYCQDVDETFDSIGLDLGIYTGALKIMSKDPDANSVNIPVSLPVVEFYNFYLLSTHKQ
jgi:hypothetical protein